MGPRQEIAYFERDGDDVAKVKELTEDEYKSKLEQTHQKEVADVSKKLDLTIWTLQLAHEQASTPTVDYELEYRNKWQKATNSPMPQEQLEKQILDLEGSFREIIASEIGAEAWVSLCKTKISEIESYATRANLPSLVEVSRGDIDVRISDNFNKLIAKKHWLDEMNKAEQNLLKVKSQPQKKYLTK